MQLTQQLNIHGKFDFTTVLVAIVTGEVKCAIKIIQTDGSLDWLVAKSIGATL